MSINSNNIRNIAVIGHSGEGKTSVVEAILFNAHATDRLGKVVDGNTVTDSDEVGALKYGVRPTPGISPE